MAYLRLSDKAAELAAVGVAAHSDRQRLETRARIVAQMLGQQDEAGTRRKHRHALLDPGLDGREHTALHQDLALDRTLTARQHEPSGFSSRSLILRSSWHSAPSSSASLHARQRRPARQVHRFFSPYHFPRSAIKSSISSSLMPTIASPRSSESSAMIFGSS